MFWMIIGLTGGIASGKSTVARMFQDAGAIVLDADARVRESQQVGSTGYQKTLAIMGEGCVDEQGHFIREKMRRKIMENPQLLDALEENLHPIVRDYYAQELTRHDLKTQVIVLDVPLLIGYPTEKLCEKIVVTLCKNENERKKRAFARGNMTEEWWRFITQRQLTAEDFEKRADVVLQTDIPLHETQQQVEACMALFTNTKTGKYHV